MHDSKFEQSNINGDNYVSLIQKHRDTLGYTINKVFEVITDEALNPLGINIDQQDKINYNEVTSDWLKIIESVNIVSDDIERICNQPDSNWYSSSYIIKYFKLVYFQNFREPFKEKQISASQVFCGLVELTLENFRKNNVLIESHDEYVLRFLVIYSFINCGVLEKPCC